MELLPPDGHGKRPLGVGVDIVDVTRFRDMDQRTMGHFLSSSEMEEALARKDPAQTLAGRFAAKEAVIKAVRSALPNLQVSFLDIVISHSPNGAPWATLSCLHSGNYQILLSISHTKDHAIAFALVVRKDEEHG